MGAPKKLAIVSFRHALLTNKAIKVIVKPSMKNCVFLAPLTILVAFNLAHAAPMNYNPASPTQTAPAPRDFVVNDTKRAREIPIRVYLPAQTAATPVVLFSHGLGGSRAGASYLGKFWAARGYVAVFLQHPGSDENVWKNVAAQQRMATLKQAANLDNFLLRVGDVAAVLDQLEIWDKAANSPLAGRMDMTKIGMAGHSFGAVTTEAVSGETTARGAIFTDARLKAAIVMSPSAPKNADAQQAFGAVKIPWLLMTGTLDNSPIGGEDAASRLRVFAALPKGDKYQLILNKAEHSAFTDNALRRDAAPRNPNHHRAIEAISTAFWDAYLKGDANAKTWLESDKVRDVLEAADVWQTK